MKISSLYGRLFAPWVLCRVLAKLGNNVRIAGLFTIRGGKNVEIGNDFFAGPDFYLSTNSNAKVTIGDAVMLGPGVMILGGNHDYAYSKAHMRFNQQVDASARDIVISNGSWIGARAVILSGANVGEGSVIGACSVVNKEVPPYCVAAGNNLKIIKPRFENIVDLEACLENTESTYSVKDILEQYEKHGFVLK